jgi:acyl-CoA synthetase
MIGAAGNRLNSPSPATIAAYTASGVWGDETIYRIVLRQARARPQAWAVRDRRRRLSYEALVAAADRLAAHLAGHGLQPGERVAVWLPSRVETAIALLAASRNGYLCCPSLHRDHTVAAVAALCQRMRAAALIAEPGSGADADRNDIFSRLAGLDFLRCAWCVGPADAPPFAALSDPPRDTAASDDADQPMYLAFTSGTSGAPKGVVHSDNTLLAAPRAMIRDWRLERAVLYTLSPLSHNLGLGALVTALAAGGELVVHDLLRGESLVDRLDETGAEFLFGVPTHAVDLLAEIRGRRILRVGRVRAFRISGAAAPVALAEGLLRHGIVPQSGYGMTETCSHQYTLPDDPPRRGVETCGRACTGYEIRIFDRDDPNRAAAPGEIGEIGGRGASLMLGYFEDPEATAAAFNASGWFMTGDLGWIDEDGYLRVTGRKKDVIIRGGRNIDPAPIEALALRHEAIAEAAAFPVADTRLGERICLAIVAREAASVDAETILAFLEAGGLSRYDLPEFFLPLPAMPLTASGKLLKRELVRLVAEGRVRPLPVDRWPRQAAAPP